MNVSFRVAGATFAACLNGGPITTAIAQQLPIASSAQRWGDEIYFDVPVSMANTAPTVNVRVGDIAYWPEGPCLCIFFGKTPASTGNAPRPASEVTVIGSTSTPVALLRSVKQGAPITVDHAGPH